MSSVKNKVVWITGASSGIGEALGHAFAKAGAKIIISGRDIEGLQKVKDGCKSASVAILPLDLTNSLSIKEKAAIAIRIYGGIDILINNAGISQRSLAAETSDEVYRRIIEVNFLGAIKLTQEVLRHFMQKNEGNIVTISSIAGITGLPYRTAYCASKHGLEGFFAALRTELWRSNVKILMVRPGAVKTNIARHALTADGTPFNRQDKIIENGMEPAYVASAVLKAVEKNKSELMIGSFKERSLFVLNRFFPKLVFNAVKNIKH